MPKESKGYLDYNRIRPREDFFKLNGTVPHDSRFEIFNYFPKVASKTQYY